MATKRKSTPQTLSTEMITDYIAKIVSAIREGRLIERDDKFILKDEKGKESTLVMPNGWYWVKEVDGIRIVIYNGRIRFLNSLLDTEETITEEWHALLLDQAKKLRGLAMAYEITAATKTVEKEESKKDE